MRDEELRRLFQRLGDPVAEALNPPAPAHIRHRGRRRRRRVALSGVTALLLIAAAGVGVVQARNLGQAPATHPSPATAAPTASAPPSSGPPAPPSSAAGQASSTTATTMPLGRVGELHAIQFVSAAQGWAAGKGAILVTSDGGRHWGRQYGGDANLLAIDFVDARHGWALATDPTATLLGTADGGQHWRALGEPPGGALVKVHFHTARQGFGVAYKHSDPRTTRLVASSDGGASWRWLPNPAGAGAGMVVSDVCFSRPGDGWLVTSSDAPSGAAAVIWRAARGPGQVPAWSRSYQPATGGDPITGVQLQCAGPGAAWVELAGGGAAGHVAYVLLNTRDGSAWKAVLVNRFTWGSLYPGVPDGPGSFPGPFSAVDQTTAFALGSTPAAGDFLAGLLARAGTRPAGQPQRVPALSAMRTPQGVSFISDRVGWVAGVDRGGRGVILATSDGGRTWQAQLG
jgi:photosystem II stability/assembly factor-like uncharacterized protein